MCGRFGLWLEEGIYHRFNILGDKVEIPKGYNIAPGMKSFVVTRNSPNKGVLMQWGLIPPWTKDARSNFKMINARAETILEKPTYRTLFKNNRCLIPFNAFYEWKREGRSKVPYLFHDKREPYLAFAGLYENGTFTIITTKANSSMKGAHDRMPVILNPEEEDIWLNKDTSQDKLISLLDGYESKTFEVYPISTQINSTKNDSPSIIP